VEKITVITTTTTTTLKSSIDDEYATNIGQNCVLEKKEIQRNNMNCEF